MEYFVAVDLGTNHIKGMVARKNEEGKLEILASESVDSKGIRNGMVANMSDAAFAVRRVLTLLENKEPLRSLNATIEQIYVGLGGKSLKTFEHTVTRVLPYDDEEVTQAMIDEMQEECWHLPIDIKSESGEIKQVEILEVRAQEFLVDDCTEQNPVGFICRNLQGKYRVVFALADLRRNLCKAILEKASVKIAGMFISPMVMAEAMLTPKEKELGAVFLDFGAGTTSVSVYQNHYLRYVAVVPFGGNELTEDLKELKLVAEDAEDMKVECGNALAELEKDVKIYISPASSSAQGLEISSQLMASILEERLKEILGYVGKYLEKSAYASRLGAGAVIGGGASKLKNIQKLVSRELGMETRFCNAENNVATAPGEDFDYLSYAQLIAVLNFAQTSCVQINEQPKAKSKFNFSFGLKPKQAPKTKPEPKQKPAGPSIFDIIIKKTGIDEIFNDGVELKK